jgi:S-adenosyl-L-methionine hydrolase (adenosine-forming)
VTIITLLTDFGLRDGYAGVMKGVIWKIAPEVEIADLSHDISAQDILESALVLWRSTPYFPDGTIHVAVVDPGVGTNRRGIAARISNQYFVGPDNGIFSLVAERSEEQGQRCFYYHLDNPHYWLPQVSKVFHGRDIFSSVAAHLANGTPLTVLGTQITDPVRIELPKPVATANGWQGQVIHIDHFGNLSTNLSSKYLPKQGISRIQVNDQQIDGIVTTFGERPSGTLVALIDSSGSLAISVVNGSAQQVLKARLGDKVTVSTDH